MNTELLWTFAESTIWLSFGRDSKIPSLLDNYADSVYKYISDREYKSQHIAGIIDRILLFGEEITST